MSSEERSSSPRVVTVGTANVELSGQQISADRILFTIVNTSTGGQKISLGFGVNAISGQGTVLYPGGYYSESKDQGFKPTNEQLMAISDAAGGAVSFQERVVNKGLF